MGEGNTHEGKEIGNIEEGGRRRERGMKER